MAYSKAIFNFSGYKIHIAKISVNLCKMSRVDNLLFNSLFSYGDANKSKIGMLSAYDK